MAQDIVILTLAGLSASREVLLGYAPAKLLHALSFADVLDESSRTGYQRRFNPQHSLDFRRYIKREGSTTPPLTFNLRPRDDVAWRVEHDDGGASRLLLSSTHGPLLAQVDCQHRLGHLKDFDLPLPFMVFLGLTERQEMEVFNIINGKAKGLSSSLLDYHQANLVADLGKEKPELLIALSLNDDPESPWFQQLDLGGQTTSGLKRRASLRTIQKAVRRFLTASGALDVLSPHDAARMVREFWVAIAMLLPAQWQDTRRHFLTKGVGVYALMGLLSDLWVEASRDGVPPDRERFVEMMRDFVIPFDWSTGGPLKGLGGEAGADEALTVMRRRRSETSTSPVEAHG